jgi:hypothetical protein
MREFLDDVKQHAYAQGNLLGLLNVLIGRRIEQQNGAVISVGLTWRELAGWLKKTRWDKDTARELGIDPKTLPPRDRERYWFLAIAHAKVDSAQAEAAGDRLAAVLNKVGYVVK